MKSLQNSKQPSKRPNQSRNNKVDLKVAFVGQAFASLSAARLPLKVDGKSLRVSLHSSPRDVPKRIDGVVYVSDCNVRSENITLSGKFAEYITSLRKREASGAACPHVVCRTTEITDEVGNLRFAKINQILKEECGSLARHIFNDGDPFM